MSPPVLLALSSKVPPEFDVSLSAVKATTSSAITEPPVIMTSSPVDKSLMISEPELILKISSPLPP